MIVLHAVWSARDRLCLFAEDPARVAAPARGKRPARGLPTPHPFAAGPDQLVAILGDRLDAAGEGDEAELDLVLPSTPGRPLASPAAARLALADLLAPAYDVLAAAAERRLFGTAGGDGE